MINMRSAALLLVAGCFGSSPDVEGRSYTMEGNGCLYGLAQRAETTVPETKIQFSFLPMMSVPLTAGERMASAPEESSEASLDASAEFTSKGPLVAPLSSKETDPMDDWPLLRALRHWQTPGISGLSRPFRTPNSVFALDYSDIFETGRAAYKGGHGISLFFRHQF